MMKRRAFLADMGMGMTGMALGAMLQRDGIGGRSALASTSDAWAPPDGKPHFPPRAKSVIWLFMKGGASHHETFDPKAALNKYAGKSIGDTPYKDALASPFLNQNRVLVPVASREKTKTKLFPMQVGFRKHGQSGIEVTDWWPNLAKCVDDMAIVRSIWTTDTNHQAQYQFHSGRNALEGRFPTVGAWVHYGLGSLNDNLPSFIVLGSPLESCCGGIEGHGANYLGPEHNGVMMKIDPDNPLPFANPGGESFKEEQEAELALLGELNGLVGVEYPDDPVVRARIKSYEMAARMQTAAPELLRFQDEKEETRKLYGLDIPEAKAFGEQCLAARRMVERGVRFVQVFHGNWDAHSGLRENHRDKCAQTDKPIAGLLADLKRRGLLDQTLVVWGTEFGRTPGGEGSDGRDHHPFGFSVWFAGGGIRGGITHGATDELGFHAVENRHYVTDVHATVLHQLGLDPRKLDVPGRKRLEVDYGNAIKEITA